MTFRRRPARRGLNKPSKSKLERICSYEQMRSNSLSIAVQWVMFSYITFAGCPLPLPISIIRFASAISAFISAMSTLSFSSHSSRVWA